MDKLSIFRITVALSLALTVDALCESDAVAMDPAANTKADDKATKKPQKKTAKKKVKETAAHKSERTAPKQEEQVRPMTEALSSAYVTNSTLKAKLYELYANDETVSQAMAKFRPSIVAQGSVGVSKTRFSNLIKNELPQELDAVEPPTIVTQRDHENYTTRPKQAQIQINQNIFNGWQDVSNLWASESGVKASEFDLKNTEQDTLQKAANAYMQVIFQTSAVKYYELNVSYLHEQLKSKKAQLEVGEVTATDVASSESSLAQGMAQLATAQQQLLDAKATYLQVIGEKPGLLEFPKPLAHLPKTLEEVIEIGLQNNPAIINALYVAKQNDYLIDAKTGALLPQLAVQGTASRAIDQSRGNTDQTNQASATLTLTVPIYNNGGADYSVIRQQVESTASARYNLEQARKSTVENATKAWDAWIAAMEQIKDLTVQVAAATKARDNAAKEAAVGERSYTEVLQFQSQLITAEVNLEQARRDEILAQYGLYFVMGILTADYLKLPVSLNEIKEHYQDAKWAPFGFGDQPKILDVKDEQLETAQID